MSEINRLEWADVNLEERYVLLYTRKIDGGLSPRKIPMNDTLYRILARRFKERDTCRPWVFWNPRTGLLYKARSKFMKRLCVKAGV